MSEIYRPKEIAFEGLDGAGKTTHIRRLQNDLEDVGLRVGVVSSPGKGWMGCTLRAHIGDLEPERKNVLFTRDILRTQRAIPSTLDVVLWDRQLDSVIVSNTDDAKGAVEAAAVDVRRPDVTIFLNIPAEVSWERENGVSDHPIDKDWIAAKLRRYNRLLESEPERFDIINAAQPLDQVYQEIKERLLHEFGPIIEENKKATGILFDTPGVVRFLIDDPAEVKPGVFLPMFMNFKTTWSNPGVRKEFTNMLIRRIGESYDWIIGLESGGSYYATSVANELNRPVSHLRKEDKKYGDRNILVGDTPPPGSRVALVDDVYATGQSSSRAAGFLEEVGCQATLFTIFSYSSDIDIRNKIGIEGTSLTYFKAVRSTALERGLITSGQGKLLTEQVEIYRNTVFE